MSNYRTIDIENWDRKEQFLFFRDYDDPFFGLSAGLDVTRLLAYTRSQGYSFFAACLFASQSQVNRIPEFRYRIRRSDVIAFDEVLAGSTILKDNQTFTFCYFDHYPAFRDFNLHVIQRVAACREPDTLLVDQDHHLAQVHYSVIPWIYFTGLSHPRNYGTADSIPKIVFGKYEDQGGRMLMPLSVEAHHALLDGFHMGLYFKGFQAIINDPETLLEG